MISTSSESDPGSMASTKNFLDSLSTVAGIVKDGEPSKNPHHPQRTAKSRSSQMASAAASPVSPSPISREHRGNVLVVSVDNPPVNALGVDVRRGLADAIEAAQADATVCAVVI